MTSDTIRDTVRIEGRPAVVRHTNPSNSGEPQGWYIASACNKFEFRRDRKWHFGFDGKEKPWDSEEAAWQFVKLCVDGERESTQGPTAKLIRFGTHHEVWQMSNHERPITLMHPDQPMGKWFSEPLSIEEVKAKHEVPSPPAAGELPDAESLVKHLIEHNAVHRSGTVLGKEGWDTVIRHLNDEVWELAETVLDYSASFDERTLEELADVHGVLIHAALKAGYTMEQVERKAIDKLRLRFTIDGKPIDGGWLKAAAPAQDERAITASESIYSETLREENARLRKALDDVNSENTDLKDCREALRDLGRYCGCDHVEGPDERQQQVRHIEQAFEKLIEEKKAAHAELDELRRRLEKSEAFKTWVHSFLDGKGVPQDPDPEANKQHGCRISGRFKWLFDELDELRRRLERAQCELKTIESICFGGMLPDGWNLDGLAGRIRLDLMQLEKSRAAAEHRLNGIEGKLSAVKEHVEQLVLQKAAAEAALTAANAELARVTGEQEWWLEIRNGDEWEVVDIGFGDEAEALNGFENYRKDMHHVRLVRGCRCVVATAYNGEVAKGADDAKE